MGSFLKLLSGQKLAELEADIQDLIGSFYFGRGGEASFLS